MKTKFIRLFVLSLSVAAFGAISMAPSYAVTVDENPNEGRTYGDGYSDGYDYGYQQGLAQGNTGTDGQQSACCGQPSQGGS